MGGLGREEKWRPDRNGTPEGWLRRGRVSHPWRDPQGLRSGGRTPSVSPAQSAWEVCPALWPGPLPSEAPSRPRWSWGRRREARGENRRGRWEGPSKTWRRRRGGHLPCPLELRKPAELPGGIPCPLRPEAQALLAPSVLLSLSPTSHTPRAFSSPVSPEHRPPHRPNPTPA